MSAAACVYTAECPRTKLSVDAGRATQNMFHKEAEDLQISELQFGHSSSLARESAEGRQVSPMLRWYVAALYVACKL